VQHQRKCRSIPRKHDAGVSLDRSCCVFALLALRVLPGRVTSSPVVGLPHHYLRQLRFHFLRSGHIVPARYSYLDPFSIGSSSTSAIFRATGRPTPLLRQTGEDPAQERRNPPEPRIIHVPAYTIRRPDHPSRRPSAGISKPWSNSDFNFWSIISKASPKALRTDGMEFERWHRPSCPGPSPLPIEFISDIPGTLSLARTSHPLSLLVPPRRWNHRSLRDGMLGRGRISSGFETQVSRRRGGRV
jgi:hypothetical protein